MVFTSTKLKAFGNFRGQSFKNLSAVKDTKFFVKHYIDELMG